MKRIFHVQKRTSTSVGDAERTVTTAGQLRPCFDQNRPAEPASLSAQRRAQHSYLTSLLPILERYSLPILGEHHVMSSSAAQKPWFNISLASRDGADDDTDDDDAEVINWRPHPEPPKGIRNPLVEADGRLPRARLMPPRNGEVFDKYQAGQERGLGHSLVAKFHSISRQGSKAIRKNVWCVHHGGRT